MSEPRSPLMMAAVVVLVLVTACSAQPTPEPGQSTGQTIEAFPLVDSYRLSYEATCGDGPYYTEGTEIEVRDGLVSVISGEEPRRVSSLEEIDGLIGAVTADGLKVDVELDESGFLRTVQWDGRGLDDGFCLTVTGFAILDADRAD